MQVPAEQFRVVARNTTPRPRPRPSPQVSSHTRTPHAAVALRLVFIDKLRRGRGLSSLLFAFSEERTNVPDARCHGSVTWKEDSISPEISCPVHAKVIMGPLITRLGGSISHDL
jgi:hypothetical protein